MILAILGMIVGGSNLILGFSAMDPVTISTGSASLIINLMLLIGIQKNNSVLVLVWLVLNTILTAASIGIMIWLIVLVAGVTDGFAIAVICVYAMAALLNIYFLIVVWSFYKEIKRDSGTNVAYSI